MFGGRGGACVLTNDCIRIGERDRQPHRQPAVGVSCSTMTGGAALLDDDADVDDAAGGGSVDGVPSGVNTCENQSVT